MEPSLADHHVPNVGIRESPAWGSGRDPPGRPLLRRPGLCWFGKCQAGRRHREPL